MKNLEEDARERGERRKEREIEGREYKRRGASFRDGQYDSAVEEFSVVLKHTPWDVSLYTNRAVYPLWCIYMYIAQAYNRLGRYSDAIADCDSALKVIY